MNSGKQHNEQRKQPEGHKNESEVIFELPHAERTGPEACQLGRGRHSLASAHDEQPWRPPVEHLPTLLDTERQIPIQDGHNGGQTSSLGKQGAADDAVKPGAGTAAKRQSFQSRSAPNSPIAVAAGDGGIFGARPANNGRPAADSEHSTDTRPDEKFGQNCQSQLHRNGLRAPKHVSNVRKQKMEALFVCVLCIELPMRVHVFVSLGRRACTMASTLTARPWRTTIASKPAPSRPMPRCKSLITEQSRTTNQTITATLEGEPAEASLATLSITSTQVPVESATLTVCDLWELGSDQPRSVTNWSVLKTRHKEQTPTQRRSKQEAKTRPISALWHKAFSPPCTCITRLGKRKRCRARISSGAKSAPQTSRRSFKPVETCCSRARTSIHSR